MVRGSCTSSYMPKLAVQDHSFQPRHANSGKDCNWHAGGPWRPRQPVETPSGTDVAPSKGV